MRSGALPAALFVPGVMGLTAPAPPPPFFSPSFSNKICYMCRVHFSALVVGGRSVRELTASFITISRHHSGSQPSVDAPFQSMHHSYGTHCNLTFNHLQTPSLPVFCQRLKLFFFGNHFPILCCNSTTRLRLCGLGNSSAILATIKILIDIDTDISH